MEQRTPTTINTEASSLKSQVDALVTKGWEAANIEFTREQVAIRTAVQEMRAAFEATSTEGLLDADRKIQTIDIDRAAEKLRMDTIIADMHARLNNTFQGVFAQVGVLESKMADGSRGGGEFDGGSAPNSRAPRLRA